MKRVDDPEKLRVVTGESLAESLNHAGVSYVLINGLYGYPAGIGRDLDILVRPEDVPGIIARCEEIGEKLGWDRLLVRWSPYGTWQLYLIRKDTDRLSWLEVDPMLKDTMVLGAAYLLEEWGKASDFGVDYYRGPFPVSKLGHYVKSQLRPILYGDIARFRQKYALEAVADPDIVRYLQGLLGASMADRYCKATHAGIEGVSGLGKRLKWAINSRFMLRHPLRAIRNVIWSRLVRPVKLYWLTAGLVLQVVGPDMATKGAALEEARKYLDGCFDVRIKEHRIDPRREDVVRQEASITWLKHWLRVIVGCVSLTWRYYVVDRFLPRSVIQFVLNNGGMANVALDPARYGFRSAAGMSLMQAFIPHPIEIVLLPESHEQLCPPNDGQGVLSSVEQLDRWRKWAYNGRARNIAMAGSSAVESGRMLALSILQEMEVRFGVSQCKELRRVKAEYPLEGKAVP
jgi:hypothetical protein